jgi:Fe-S-cluster formation regulator IscX/YfhJ
LKKVISQMEHVDGWVALGAFGNQLAKAASNLDPRTYGFRKLSDLVRGTGAFDIDHPKGGVMRIRLKTPAKTSTPVKA